MRGLVVLVITSLVLLLAPQPAVAVYLPSPAGLQAFGEDGQVRLTWNYGQPGQYPDLDYFRIYRSVDNGQTFCLYDTVVWTGPYQPEYIDTAPSRGPYVGVYYVTAVAKDGEESSRSNTAAALPTSGGVYNPPCTGGAGSPGGGDNGGGGSDPGGGDPGGGGPGDDEPDDPGGPGGGDPGTGDDPGGGQTCDQCTVLQAILQALRDLDAGLIDVEDALWVVWSAVTGVRDAVNDLNDYLRYPTAPLPTPPAVPIGPGYSPPPAPDLTPVMPQLGQRTGRPAPTVPTLFVPPDVPAPPALPPVQNPELSPWGLPIETPREREPALLPGGIRDRELPREAVSPVEPQPAGPPLPPLQAAPPLSRTITVEPQPPLSPAPALQPQPLIQPDSPLLPASPLVPSPPLTPRR